MARTKWNPEVGPVPKNKGGAHGGINPNAPGKQGPSGTPAPGSTKLGGNFGNNLSAPSQGGSGNPGLENPWEGSDATLVGATTALPAVTHLGVAGGGHDPAVAPQNTWSPRDTGSLPEGPGGSLGPAKGGHDIAEAHP